jgi:RNA polymerase sigma-70 factor (ECF subfamily)
MSAICPMTETHNASSEAAARPVVSLSARRAANPMAREQRRQDRELVRSILDGNSEAFDRLYALYAQRVYRFAVSRLRDPVEAEDVVQDTFLEVHRCLASWEGRSRLLTWMFGIAHHQLCRRFRKKTPIGVPIEQLEASPPIAAETSGEERLDALRALEVCAFVLDEAVSDSQREIFGLYYGESRPMKQIAKELGKSSQAVKISLYRTRKAMGVELDALELRQSA